MFRKHCSSAIPNLEAEDASADVSCQCVHNRNIGIYLHATHTASISLEGCGAEFCGHSNRAMSGQTVFKSLLSKYENDNNAINELCRTCLCKVDKKHVSIDSVQRWSEGESCSAQQLIEQMLNRQV